MLNCIVNGNKFDDVSTIENLTHNDFRSRCIYDIPKSLFKYFPNSYGASDKNYSMEAIETNTVFMQDPSSFNDPYDSYLKIDEELFLLTKIKCYLSLAKISFTDNETINDLIIKFACFVNDKMSSDKNFFHKPKFIRTC